MFLVVFAVYLASPVRQVTDSFWAVMTARSLVKSGDVNLDEYSTLITRNPSFQIERHGGHAYYEVPVATSLASVPIVAIASVVDGRQLDRDLAVGHTQPYDGLAAALIAAATAAVVFAIARRLDPRLWIATATALIFAFGTQAWSIASRTMWMHSPSMLCLALGLLFALRARGSPRWFPALGAVLTVAYFVRPTNAVPLVVFGIWALTRGRPAVVRFLAGAAATTAIFLLLDELLYGELLQSYFRASKLSISPTAFEALVGNLVSPSRGLFVFVPVAILAIYGFRQRQRTGTLTSLDIAVTASIVGYWIGISFFPHWWGGWSYGPRFLTDVTPLIAWFLPSALDRLASSRRAEGATVAAIAIVVSVAIQAHGAFDHSTVEWNWKPIDVDAAPGRVWDWSDPQFLR